MTTLDIHKGMPRLNKSEISCQKNVREIDFVCRYGGMSLLLFSGNRKGMRRDGRGTHKKSDR